MEKKETAEQKLLKIIEASSSTAEATSSPAAAGSEVASEIAASVKTTGLPNISLTSLLSPLMNLFGGKLSASNISFGINEFNKILALGVAVTGIIVGVNFFNDMQSMKKKIDFKIESPLAQGMDNLLPQVKQITDYLSNIQKRNIFQPFEKKEVPVEEAIPVETRQITTMAKNLKLVGISWLDSAESATALIEDTQSGATYFLKIGEKVNDITVKNIFADRIILSYQGEDLVVKL